MTERRCLPGDLPIPTPLPGTVMAGMFGITEDGPLCPDQDEVRAITEEQACELVALLVDLTHLEWCSKYALDPSTGQPPRPDQQARLSERLQREIAHFSERYECCLDVYAEAFRCDASALLDAAVRRFVAAHWPPEAPVIQRQLF